MQTSADSTPLFSVVICSYNAEAFLPAALNSILQQSLQAIEILVVDDGSRDGTVDYLRSVRDTRLRLIVLEQNVGLLQARMLGFRQARAPYIAVMDADDIAAPLRLERQYQVLSEGQVDVCGSFHYSWNAQTGRRRMKPSLVRNADLRAMLTLYSPLCNPSVSFRRSLLDEVGYEAQYLHAEDYAFWCALSLRDHRFACIPEPLLTYRVHAGQISQVRLDAAREAFSLAQRRYIQGLLGLDLVPGPLPFDQRRRVATDFIHCLASRLGRLSFRACYELYASFQFRRNGLVTLATRLERLVVALYASSIWR
jgi:glycosyltransferase involved in cell wall biosynthesis